MLALFEHDDLGMREIVIAVVFISFSASALVCAPRIWRHPLQQRIVCVVATRAFAPRGIFKVRPTHLRMKSAQETRRLLRVRQALLVSRRERRPVVVWKAAHSQTMAGRQAP